MSAERRVSLWLLAIIAAATLAAALLAPRPDPVAEIGRRTAENAGAHTTPATPPTAVVRLPV